MVNTEIQEESHEMSEHKPMNEVAEKEVKQDKAAVDEAADRVAKLKIANDLDFWGEDKHDIPSPLMDMNKEAKKITEEDDREATLGTRKTKAIEEVKKIDEEFIKLNLKVKVAAARLRLAKQQLGYAEAEETRIKRDAGRARRDPKVTQQKLQDIADKLANWKQEVAMNQAEEEKSKANAQAVAERAREARKEAATAAQEAVVFLAKKQHEKQGRGGGKRVANPPRNAHPPPPSVPIKPPPPALNLIEFPPLK